VKQVTIISGKGGTGKTTVTGAFAALASNLVLADCDVDAADLHLIIKPTIRKKEVFHGLSVASVDLEKCTGCLRCVNSCVFDAISEDISIQYSSCEGCGVCHYVCPVDAISMKKRDSGEIYTSDTRFGPMIHARLYTAEEASGKLVTMVRNKAEELALSEKKDLVLIDGPPGIGCPVISAITGVDLVVIVTEPTFSGIHDLKRVGQVAKHFGIPSSVIINKSDINKEMTNEIISYCKDVRIPLIGTIPYDKTVTAAMIAEKTIPEFYKESVVDHITHCWNGLLALLDQ